MRTFVFRACWSQTDTRDCYTIRALDRQYAEMLLKSISMKPHHWDYVCEITGELN